MDDNGPFIDMMVYLWKIMSFHSYIRYPESIWDEGTETKKHVGINHTKLDVLPPKMIKDGAMNHQQWWNGGTWDIFQPKRDFWPPNIGKSMNKKGDLAWFTQPNGFGLGKLIAASFARW